MHKFNIMQLLLQDNFTTPFEAFPFDKVTAEMYEPAIEKLLLEAKEAIDKIAHNPAEPSFENTILAIEQHDKKLNRVIEAFFNINSAETNDHIQDIAERIAPKLSNHSNDIMQNEPLFHRVKKVYEASKSENLDTETQRLIDKTYKSFVRNGALLPEEQKLRLKDIDEALSTLKLTFGKHVLDDTNQYHLHLTTDADVAGIPTSILAQAKELAKSLAYSDGYVFNLHYPSYVPFMKYAANRAHRATMYTAYMQRGYQANGNNNEDIIKRITQLKHERANLLGYKHHADYVLAERMAGKTEKVQSFLADLLTKSKPYAERDVAMIQSIAKEDGIDTVMPYDHAYYAEKLRLRHFDIDEEALRPYFQLDNVLAAAFDLAHRLFGLSFEMLDNIPTYHESVVVYNVIENGAHKALLYTDFHPRKGKRAGAWMTSFKGQYIDQDGVNSRPHISIVCNFSPATATTPSLLTFDEVTTLFHEFGHALHGILADTRYESLSGTNVYWDFVELPSQFLENYCYEPAFLESFARHWQTQAPLPIEMIDKIVAASNFMEGYQTVRQLSFGMLDIQYHTRAITDDTSLKNFEATAMAATQLYPTIPDTLMSTSFSHIFGGGYSAGYYSYKWAEVLDADAFYYFKIHGIFDPAIAAKYKRLLSAGGSQDPMDLYIEFRGQAPSPEALLHRAGLDSQ